MPQLGIVTLNRPDNALPVMRILRPTNNATLKGVQTLASNGGYHFPVAKVEYRVTGGTLKNSPIGIAQLTSYGWLLAWDTTHVTNGNYELRAVAYDATGGSSSSPNVKVNVAN